MNRPFPISRNGPRTTIGRRCDPPVDARIRAAIVLVASLATVNVPAADVIDFESEVRPLLISKCGACHGPETQESGLRLDVRHRGLKGGDFGPVIRAGNAADS